MSNNHLNFSAANIIDRTLKSTMKTMRPTTNRIDEFESLRGLMSIWVVIGHVLLSFTPPAIMFGAYDAIWRVFIANGKAVDIFIILSGFAIFHLIHTSQESYSRYIVRRFLRLFPAYLVCLLISVAMLPITDAALHSLLPFTDRTFNRLAILQSSVTEFWPHLLAHLTMLHGVIPSAVLPNTDYTFLGQAWSISVEWQFYLLAPLLLWLATRRPRLIGLAVLALLCAGLFHARLKFNEGFIGAHIGYFAIGCLSFFGWQADRRLLATLARYSMLVIPGVCVIWVLVLPNEWQAAVWLAILLSCNSMRFASPGYLERAISATLLTPTLRWLGRISYPIYLTHMIALNAMLWLLSGASLAAIPMVLLTLLGTMLATLIFADLLHRWVELPAIALGRRLPVNLFTWPLFFINKKAR